MSNTAVVRSDAAKHTKFRTRSVLGLPIIQFADRLRKLRLNRRGACDLLVATDRVNWPQHCGDTIEKVTATKKPPEKMTRTINGRKPNG
jgi:hypothetical protein